MGCEGSLTALKGECAREEDLGQTQRVVTAQRVSVSDLRDKNKDVVCSSLRQL